MNRCHIAAVFLAFFLFPMPAFAGDLAGAVNALENLADVARAADDAQDSFRDAVRANPSRHRRHYIYYRDDCDDDCYYQRDYRHHHPRHKHKHHKRCDD